MPHPAQQKYGSCKGHQKDGKPCGLAVVRAGFCMYHQLEETHKRLMDSLEKNELQRKEILKKIQDNHNENSR